jgi:hypothetical protein
MVRLEEAMMIPELHRQGVSITDIAQRSDVIVRIVFWPSGALSAR